MAKKAHGFALVWTLLILVFLFLLAGALLQATHQQLFVAGSTRDRQQALLAAEAGLAEARRRLQADPDWSAGFDHKELPGGGGDYTLTFETSGSRNNLKNHEPMDSRLGPGSVPSHTALLLISGRSRGVTRELEVLLGSGAEDLGPSALAGTGRIFLEGNVSVRGVESLVNATAVEAGVHANSLGEDVKIRWRAGSHPTASARISGKATSAGASPPTSPPTRSCRHPGAA